ncbi:hypothetical protein [Thermococcus piezophilus]|uniref:ACT domain-containing protein n=1 Tax=Thermococcus piezophilus TaxID=1712654 RepID=A0A172WEP7_9EURY|nr:hypothetical protein [Thermococcus piezophilus]ANF21904.1 hypothetical protein A7C91_00830 [Thermococcus piezophilus]
MQIVELNIRLPYEGRGKILGRLYENVRGKIRDIHFFPPDAEGISEIRMEIEADNGKKLVKDLMKIVGEGKVLFKVLSEV